MLKALILLSSFSLLIPLFANASDSSYCVSVRGNGQLAPAHWGSLANIIEKKQAVPIGGAGGSSGSVSLFILDSLSQSPLAKKVGVSNYSLPANSDYESIKSYTDKIEPNKLAFLLKSVLPHLQVGLAQVSQKLNMGAMASIIKSSSQLKELQKSMEASQQQGQPIVLDGKMLQALINSKLGPLQKDLITVYGSLGDVMMAAQQIVDNYYLMLLGPLQQAQQQLAAVSTLEEQAAVVQKSIQGLMANPETAVRLDNLIESLKVFGKFDAQNDPFLFFRTGIIDFRKFSNLLATAMNMYNHPSLTPECLADSKNCSGSWSKSLVGFMQACPNQISGDKRQVWFAPGTTCSDTFNALVYQYYKQEVPAQINSGVALNKLSQNKVGTALAMVITTSVVLKESGQKAFEYLEAYKNYGKQATNLADITSYSVDHIDHLKYGYWYNQDYTKHFNEEHFNSLGGVKNGLFFNLGNTTWEDVIAVSPAEPGLTSMQPFMAETSIDGKPGTYKLASFGGWSNPDASEMLNDLKDKNGKNICEETITITREDVESSFGQAMYMRVSGYSKTLMLKSLPSPDSCELETISSRLAAQPDKKSLADAKINADYKTDFEKSQSLSVFDWTKYLKYDHDIDGRDQCFKLSDEAKVSGWYELYYPWINDSHRSSLKTYLGSATDVYCTNWNDYDPFAQKNIEDIKATFQALLHDGYNGELRSESAEVSNRVGCWWNSNK